MNTNKIRIREKLLTACSILSVALTITCFCIKIPHNIATHKTKLRSLTIGLATPNKKISTSNEDYVDPPVPNNNIAHSTTTPEKQNDNHNDAQSFKIIETKIGESGVLYDNFYFKKSTNISTEINIEKELNLRPDIHIKKDGSPQVLIYHTHTTESYMHEDRGFYYSDFVSRSSDPSQNVTAVGDAITTRLNQAGICAIHDKTVHDSPSYSGSYKRSAETIAKNLSQHPSINVTIDIHRDSLGSNETGKIKPTFRANGKKAAQIMIISGCDENNDLDFPHWEYNLRFALRLQRCAETLYRGITRPMSFTKSRYNMNLTRGSILVEVGTDMNTLTEAKYSGQLLGDALVQVLNELTD